MIVLWNKQVEIQNLWEPECFGLFTKKNDQVTFFFKHRNDLLSIDEVNTKPRLVYSHKAGDKFSLPISWNIVKTPNTAFLLFSNDQGINLESNVFTDNIPLEIQTVYLQQKRPEKYLVESPQHLGEFTIIHKGNCGYICKRKNKELWEFIGRAYLYTDIVRWEDRIFFGTGGYGGYFYVLDIQTGLPLVSLKTGGTQCFVHSENYCYVLRNEKTAQLLCIDLSDGRCVTQCDLPGKATIESRIARIDNCIHLITFQSSRSKVNGFTWSCIECGNKGTV